MHLVCFSPRWCYQKAKGEIPMASYTVRQQRIARGLCTDCGGERTGEKHTTRNCGVCAERRRIASQKWRAAHPEKHRARLKKRYETRKAENRCVSCAKPRKGLGGTTNLCSSCAKKHRASLLACQQRKRNARMGYTKGDGRMAKKYPVGALPPPSATAEHGTSPCRSIRRP